MFIHVFTTGGTIDKVYFDQLSEFLGQIQPLGTTRDSRLFHGADTTRIAGNPASQEFERFPTLSAQLGNNGTCPFV